MNDSENMTQVQDVTSSTFRIVGEPGALFAALAAAAAEFLPVLKTKSVHVQPREGRAYDFDYAPLENVLAATRAALSKNGLCLIQACPSDGDGFALRTMLAHSSGAFLEQVMWMRGTDRAQELGSRITYYRRYSAQCLLGINAEDDDDGNAADGNAATPQNRATPPAPPPREEKPKASKAKAPPEPKPAPEPKTEATGPLDDSGAPDIAVLVREGTTFAALLAAFDGAGIHGREAMAEAVRRELKNDWVPGQDLTYGDARRLIAALAAHDVLRPELQGELP